MAPCPRHLVTPLLPPLAPSLSFLPRLHPASPAAGRAAPQNPVPSLLTAAWPASSKPAMAWPRLPAGAVPSCCPLALYALLRNPPHPPARHTAGWRSSPCSPSMSTRHGSWQHAPVLWLTCMLHPLRRLPPRLPLHSRDTCYASPSLPRRQACMGAASRSPEGKGGAASQVYHRHPPIVLLAVVGVHVRRLGVGGAGAVGVCEQALDGGQDGADVVDGGPAGRPGGERTSGRAPSVQPTFAGCLPLRLGRRVRVVEARVQRVAVRWCAGRRAYEMRRGRGRCQPPPVRLL